MSELSLELGRLCYRQVTVKDTHWRRERRGRHETCPVQHDDSRPASEGSTLNLGQARLDDAGHGRLGEGQLELDQPTGEQRAVVTPCGGVRETGLLAYVLRDYIRIN